ncbi:MAG: hypothetical protein KC478_11375 [Bacteriovoracaceae bacterium]|nr:hypothetical protein [Bacteriovoracaceae bacterium]
MTKLTLFTLLSLVTNSLFAVDFKHFKLKNELEELSKAKSPKTQRQFMALGESAQDRTIETKVAQKLLNLSEKSASGPGSALMKKISEALSDHYNKVGKEQTTPLVLNHNMGGGVLNFSGFTWKKPFANFKLYVNRQLSQDLYSDGWIVHDKLVIGIDASTLLTNLQQEDLIEIDKEGIGAFAGVSFIREYQYNHKASTFLEGLQSDYSKLFLSFTKFNPEHVLNLPPYNFLRQKDTYSFNAGGMVKIPTGGTLSGRVGVLVNSAYERTTTIQVLGEDDSPKEGEFLRLNIDKKVEKGVDAHLSLQVDFFNLLKLTLLSADLEYRYGMANSTYYSFYEKDKQFIATSSAHASEFKKLINGQIDEAYAFKKNIVQLEERINENFNSKYSALLLGQIKKRETEQIKIIRDGVEKIFFKHYAESIKFVQSLWSRMFGIVINRLFDWDPGVVNAAESKKKLAIEFEYMEDLGEAKVDSSEKFSLSLTQSFQAAKTHRWWHSYYKRESRNHILNMTNLDPKYEIMVKDEVLRGPIEVVSKVKVLSAGIAHFNFLDEKNAFKKFKEMCEGRKKSCFNLLKKRYLSYMSHFHRYGISDLMRFKSFIGSYFKRLRTYKDLYTLFGKENVFMNGQLSAVTNKGLPFSTYFKEGEFQGLGVIDSFMREGVSRAPANISTR